MADLYSRNVNTKFSGLTTTVALFGVVGLVALVGFETFRQMRRLPTTHFARFWRKDMFARQGGRGGIERHGDDRGGNAIGTRDKLTCEDWEMGHLYLAREFHATTPSPKMAQWPLSWAWQAIKFDDWFYATHTGMDTVVYVRFLRACMWWMVLQTFTTAPILLAIHFHYAVETHRGQSQFSLNDMSQASLSYLVTTTVCMCADGRNQSTPCDDNSTSTSTDRKSQLTDYANCQHIPNEDGRKLLWVHLLLAWYLAFTWFYALWWIGRGSLRIRRRWVEEIRTKRREAVQKASSARANRGSASNPSGMIPNDEKADGSSANRYTPEGLESRKVLEESHALGNIVRGDDHDGWRQRTLLVTNLPPTMRDEASIRRYFEEFLRPDDEGDDDDGNQDDDVGSSAHRSDGHGASVERSQSDKGEEDKVKVERGEAQLSQGKPGSSTTADADIHNMDSASTLQSPVQTVVLVRKMNELSAMLSRRQEVLAKLEAAHIKLAQTVMSVVGKHTKTMRNSTDKKYGGVGAMGGLGKSNSKLLKRLRSRTTRHKDTASEDKKGNSDLEESAADHTSEETQRLNELTRRLARFSPANVGVHMREAQTRGESELGGREMGETVWEALAEIPRELLDPYQPVTRLSSLFRGQKVPTIDYLLTKLNLLSALVTEMRARPPSSYEATSTAFVTFRDPRQARMVWRELKTQIVVKVRLAPEVKDLDWERLMRTSFTGDIVRGLGVNTFFWIFTIVWVIPVALLTTSLFSVEKLEGIFPPLQAFFRNNPRFEGFISVTLPTIIVSLLTLAVPELIFQISKRAQGFVTFSALYDQCLCRYWKFVICNVVIFFCIGATTVQSIIFQLGTNNNVLNAIAFSFPTAAPFYISYLILGMGVHTGFELFGFMVPLIQHVGARKAATPRIRALKTLPRNFNRYYWLPLHVLVMSIAFLFAILNPLIIPFALAYLWVAMIVFKKNFAFQYYRRFNEKEGVLYFIRLLRFSLDGLLLAQVVLLVFFSVTQQEGAYIGVMAVLIPLNVAVKLLGTRLWKSQCRAVEDDEANALCGIGLSDDSAERSDGQANFSASSHLSNSSVAQMPVDARASGRYPAAVTAPPSNSRILSWWVRVQDKFHANGNERPSALNGSQGGHGINAKTMTNVVAGKPVTMAKRSAQRSKVLINASKARGDVPASGFEMRKSMAYSSAFPVHHTSDGGNDRLSNEQKKTAGPLASASALDLKRALEDGDNNEARIRFLDIEQQQGRPVRRHASTGRSESAPFLSGYDAVANHAPVPDDVGDDTMEFGDGEYEEMLSLRRREMASHIHRRRSRSRRSASHVADAFDGPANTDDMDVKQPLTTHDIVKSVDASKEKNEAADELESESFDDSIEGGPLVRPHANVRWEDTPNNHARYNNPFYSVELDPFLWLPRDPLAPVDLCDTIEWHGTALVSSQGGQGRVGEWDEDEDDADAAAEQELNMSQLLMQQDADVDTRDSTIRHVNGDEKIEITGILAQRIQEAEDAEESANPADSIPRNQLDDFKRALEDEEMETIDEETDSAHHVRSPDSPVQSRRRSMRHPIDAQRHRTSSMSSEPYAIYDAERTPLTGNTPREELGRAEGGLEMPTSSSQGHNAPIRTNSVMSTASSATAAAAQRRISMKKALRAEVLEEEYLRTVKDRVAERKARGSDNGHSGTVKAAREDQVGESTTERQDAQPNEEHDVQSSTILARHQSNRRRTSLARKQERRGSIGSEVATSRSPVLRATTFTSAVSKTGEHRSGPDEHVAMQDLSK